MISNPNPIQLCPATDKYTAVLRALEGHSAVVEMPVVAWSLAQAGQTNVVCGVVVTETGLVLAEALRGFIGYRSEGQTLIAFLTAHSIEPDSISNASPNPVR